MTFYDPDFSIQYVFPLMKLSEKLAITPSINLHTVKVKSSKYYSSAAAVIITICSLLTFCDTIKMSPKVRGTSTVLEVLWSLLDLLRSLVTIAVAYFRGELWDTFLQLFRHFDDRLNKKEQKKTRKDLVIIEMIFYHILLLGIFMYDSIISLSNSGPDTFKFFFVKYVGYYHCFIFILVELHFTSALRKRYKKINMLLLKTTDLQNILNNFIAHCGTTGVDNLKSIKEVTDYYLLLSEMVDIFNKLFGWQIFFLTENTIIEILLVLNTVVLSSDYMQHSPDALHDFGYLFFVVAGSVCLIVMVILYCEDVNKESRNMLKICYNLQESVQTNSEEKKELAILCDVVSLLKTRTTAAGFYIINKNLISRVFAYIFSYSIVLIQFSRQSYTKDFTSNETQSNLP